MSMRNALRVRARTKATGGTYDFVESEPVPRGEVWHINSHSFENESGQRGTARAYIDTAGYKHWLWEQTSPGSGVLYHSVDDIILSEGERLAVRQATCTSGDMLQLLGQGYIEYLNE
ncbi:hypothetical protein ES703_114310 [subsurface metagenome]